MKRGGIPTTFLNSAFAEGEVRPQMRSFNQTQLGNVFVLWCLLFYWTPLSYPNSCNTGIKYERTELPMGTVEVNRANFIIKKFFILTYQGYCKTQIEHFCFAKI